MILTPSNEDTYDKARGDLGMKKIVDIEIDVGSVWLTLEDDDYYFYYTQFGLLKDLLESGLFVNDDYIKSTTLKIAEEPAK